MMHHARLFLAGASLLVATTASAATLSGELVNVTTGEAGTADRIELVDVAQGMTPLATVEDVEGAFELTDVPESEAHLLLRVTRGDVVFSQNVPALDAPLRIEVYESTTEASAVEYARHHVIFRRDAEHMIVTELFEFDNRTDPPMTIAASSMPLRFGFTNPTHGAPTASVGSGDFPIELPVVETSQPGVLGVERSLRPGLTRMIVRYFIEYDPAGTTWENMLIYPAQDRRVLVAPSDVQLMVDQMIPTESPLEGYASYSGLPLAAGSAWTVRLAGGTAMSSGGGSGHDHDNAAPGARVVNVTVREHRFADQRVMMMVATGAILVFGLLIGATRRRSDESVSAAVKQRRDLSRLADRYVAGEISRTDFEGARDQLLGPPSKAARNGHAATKKASTASTTN